MHSLMKRLHRKRSTTTKFVNTLFILLLLVGFIPATVQAAPLPQQRPAQSCPPGQANCNKLFLPLVNAQNDAEQPINQGPIKITRPRQLRYTVGTTYQYQYDVQIDSATLERDAQGTRENGGNTTTISAIADLSITGQESDGTFDAELVLESASVVSSDGVNGGALDDATQGALKNPLRFKQTPRGVITEVSAPADAPAQAVNLQKGILNALQVTLQDGANTYAASENAGQGVVTANYTLQGQPNGWQINKQYNQDSFSTLIMAGADKPTMQLQNTVDMFLDYSTGALSTVAYYETIASGDGATNDDNTGQGFDGVTTWSKITSAGKLTLLKTLANTAPRAAAVSRTYQTTSLGADLVEDHPNQSGIDLTKVDLEQELAALESEPENPAYHNRMLALIDADAEDPKDNIDVLGKIGEHLAAHVNDEAIANAYIDVLGSVGTERAQNMLNAILGDAGANETLGRVAFGNTAKEQAMLDLVRVTAPTANTVKILETVVEQATDAELHDVAVSVLGATANRLLSSNPTLAQEVVDQLTLNLHKTSAPEDVELYLNALGNVGSPASLNTIAPYLSSTLLNSQGQAVSSIEIQAAALLALRKIQGSAAESLLVNALNDTQKPREVRYAANQTLQQRDSLSSAAKTAMTSFAVQLSGDTPGRYSKSWTRLLGNQNLGVEFPGGIEIAVPPAQSTIYGNAYQSANAWIYQHSLSVAKGELKTFKDGNDQVFGVYLSIANNLIRKSFEKRFQCADQKTGNLYSANVQFLNLTYSIPVFAVITLDINVKASGHFTLDWSFRMSVCELNRPVVEAGITPHAWVDAEASAYLNLQVVRGGATLTAKLLDTDVPAMAQLVFDAASANPGLRFCINIKATTRPLSGHLDVWVDTLSFRAGWPPFEWKRLGQATLWNFSVPPVSYDLFVRCF